MSNTEAGLKQAQERFAHLSKLHDEVAEMLRVRQGELRAARSVLKEIVWSTSPDIVRDALSRIAALELLESVVTSELRGRAMVLEGAQADVNRLKGELRSHQAAIAEQIAKMGEAGAEIGRLADGMSIEGAEGQVAWLAAHIAERKKAIDAKREELSQVDQVIGRLSRLQDHAKQKRDVESLANKLGIEQKKREQIVAELDVLQAV